MTTDPTSTSTKAEIRAFLKKALREHPLRDDEDIFAIGIVSSIFAVQLVTFVENKFGISVESEDLEITNFNSVNALEQFVTVKLGKNA